MSDPLDETMSVTMMLVGIGLLIGLVIMAGVMLAPVALAGAGGIYYYRNIAMPRKKEAELQRRTRLLYEDAKRIAPPASAIIERIKRAGINDEALWDLAQELYTREGLSAPDEPPSVVDTIAAARYRDQLQKYTENARPQHAEKFTNRLIRILTYLQPAPTQNALFRSKRARTPAEIEELIMEFVNEDHLFEDLRRQFDANLNEEGDVFPRDCRKDDYAWRYLKGTPLLDFTHITQDVELVDRMRHTYLVGSSGSGKTSLIENIIAGDLSGSEDCCVVVIDSQTQLTNKLAELDIPDVTYITPEWNLALNLFDVGYAEMKAEGVEGETLINKTVGLISFAMEGMMGSEFTNPQKTIFQYAIQLVISIPGGNIFTFMDILSDDGHLKYADQIAAFDANTQRFFEKDFGSEEYKRSREAIRRRLDSLLLNPTFRRLFSATENRFDMFSELRDKRLILIDTNKPLLDNDASSFFGRLFIAMIVRASHMRFKNRHEKFRPVYLVVDEAHEYFDQSISDMLEQARKANIGMIVAHQSLSQAKGEGRRNIADPLMVNTATKIVWTSYRKDAAEFAGNMQVQANTILSLPQYTFGLYSRTQGFLPIRGKPDAFADDYDFPLRGNPYELQEEMEDRYGPSSEAMRGARAEDPMRQEDPKPKGNGDKPLPTPGSDIPDEPEII